MFTEMRWHIQWRYKSDTETLIEDLRAFTYKCHHGNPGYQVYQWSYYCCDLTFVLVTTNFTLTGLIAAVVKRQRRKPLAIILFTTASKPDLCPLLSSRPGDGLSQAHSWYSSVPATYIGYIIPPILFSIFPNIVFVNQPIIHRDSSVGIATSRSCRTLVRIPVGGSILFSETSILSLGHN